MQVRILTSEDADVWRALRLDGLKRFPEAFLTLYEEALARPIAQVAERLGHGNTLGVFDDGACVGIASLHPQDRPQTRHRAEVSAVYVRPSAHGTGAGDALMSGLLDHARTIGCWQTELYVAERNSHAIALYERHGFVRVGRMPNTAITHGIRVHDLIMVHLAPEYTQAEGATTPPSNRR